MANENGRGGEPPSGPPKKHSVLDNGILAQRRGEIDTPADAMQKAYNPSEVGRGSEPGMRGSRQRQRQSGECRGCRWPIRPRGFDGGGDVDVGRFAGSAPGITAAPRNLIRFYMIPKKERGERSMKIVARLGGGGGGLGGGGGGEGGGGGGLGGGGGGEGGGGGGLGGGEGVGGDTKPRGPSREGE